LAAKRGDHKLSAGLFTLDYQASTNAGKSPRKTMNALWTRIRRASNDLLGLGQQEDEEASRQSPFEEPAGYDERNGGGDDAVAQSAIYAASTLRSTAGLARCPILLRLRRICSAAPKQGRVLPGCLR
jgi:hypothetical protein